MSQQQQQQQQQQLVSTTTMWLLIVGLVVIVAPSLTTTVQADLSRDELIRSMGFAEIKIIEAHVPDLDPAPFQQDSDVYVKLYLNDTKEAICETNVVQDTNNPQFNKECRTPKPISADTILRFELFDSDKPNKPDEVGTTRVKITDLILNDKINRKESFAIEGRKYPKHYLKIKVEFKPEKQDDKDKDKKKN